MLNNDPATCPERIPSETPTVDLASALEPPKRRPRFTSSSSLAPEDIAKLSQKQYCNLIGILGAPDAGKTALLVSLYLLLSRRKLVNYKFLNSLSIRAFDEISRGARRWNQGRAPEQMTSHTELPDERVPGFLHLRLQQLNTRTKFDFVLPDLPGEWSTSLIDHCRVDRLQFLKSADLLWLTIDGRQLSQPKLRQQVLHRTSLLFERVASLLAPEIPPVFLVISHLDLGIPEERNLKILGEEATRFGINAKPLSIASFSDNRKVNPGAGIPDLLNETIARLAPNKLLPFWPDKDPVENQRFALQFRLTGSLHS